MIVFDLFRIERSMSTQYTAFWCFFHALCMYCAWRDAFKSIVSRSLWFLCMTTANGKKKPFVCCSKFDFQDQSRTDDGMSIDCTSDMTNVIEEVVRNNNIVFSSRINQIAFWLALKSSEVQDYSWKSVQYWYLFLFPPFASVLFHFSSINEKKYSVVLTLGERLTNYFLAKYQSKFFHQWVMVFVDELAKVCLCGLHSHSWVRFSHGLIMDLSNNNKENDNND